MDARFPPHACGQMHLARSHHRQLTCFPLKIDSSWWTRMRRTLVSITIYLADCDVSYMMNSRLVTCANVDITWRSRTWQTRITRVYHTIGDAPLNTHLKPLTHGGPLALYNEHPKPQTCKQQEVRLTFSAITWWYSIALTLYVIFFLVTETLVGEKTGRFFFRERMAGEILFFFRNQPTFTHY